MAEILHRRGAPTAESKELLSVAEELGVLLEPMHPGTDDPLLTPYFTIEAADSISAERIIAHLRRSRAIEAAYVKPPDELP